MKKTSKIIILLLSVFCITGCTVKQNVNLKKFNLLGKVKSVKITSFEAVEQSGVITKGAEHKIYTFYGKENNYQYMFFNESGMITEYSYNTMGARDETEIRNFIKYNDKGLIAENREYCLDGMNNEHSEYVKTFTYDNKDLLIEEKSGNNSVFYKYDKNGYKIEEKTIRKTTQINSNQIIDNYEFVLNFKNDDSGCKIEEYSTSYKTIFKYNDKKKLVEEQQYSILANGSVLLNKIITYEYDKKGNVTNHSEKNAEGKVFSSETYSYNENGFVSKILSFSTLREGYNKETFEYEYDSNKNWIKKTNFIANKPEYIEEREIVYFN